MAEPHSLSLREAASRIARRSLSPRELVESCLGRIDDLERDLRAWTLVDREGALAQAHRLGEEARRGEIRGALHGVPLGVKDIFYTAGLRTSAGSPLLSRFVPSRDATAVARLRRAGAIVLGKTVTTEFALLDPGPTRNPWNLEHTPGGSSSGSAAAVATCMCPGALGSQTVGSIIRPAAYCGVVGLKPTYGRISLYGVVPVSPTLDHVGVFARSVADAALLLGVVCGFDPLDPGSSEKPVPDFASPPPALRLAPRLRLIEEYFPDLASDQVKANVRGVVERLARAGAEIERGALPKSFGGVPEAIWTIVAVEAAAYHRKNFQSRRRLYGAKITAILESGLGTLAVDYAEARALRLCFRNDVLELLEKTDALLVPSAPSGAPRGLESTGDPSLNGPWSLAGLPVLGLPSGRDDRGLPLGVQLVGAPFAEERLLAVGRWCEEVLGAPEGPRLDRKREPGS